MVTPLTRRSFVKWGTAAAGATALVGFTGCAASDEGELSQTGADAASAEETGTWLTGA